MTAADPFDAGVPRGRYGRPLIIPTNRAGKPNLKAPLVEYDRASTVAGALDDGDALARWATRHAAVGIARNPDLAAIVAALGPNPDDYDANGKATLDDAINRAHDRTGGNIKADHGTAVHSLTEPGTEGVAISGVMREDAAAYVATIDAAGIVVEATETFVVNDRLKVAGTFDHAYRFTRDVTVKVNGVEVTVAAGSLLLGDKKTGSLHFDAHAIQLAIYARGQRYDHRTGERAALDVSPAWGVVAHIPREGAAATLYLVDLAEGWKGAQLAVEVRAYRLGVRKRLSGVIAVDVPNTEPADRAGVVEPATEQVSDEPVPPVDAPESSSLASQSQADVDDEEAAVRLLRGTLGATPITGGDPILDAINTAPDADACRALWAANRAAWTAAHTEAVKARLVELGRAA